MAEVTKKLASARIVIKRLEYEIQQERHTKKLHEDLIKRLQSERINSNPQSIPTDARPTSTPQQPTVPESATASHPQMSYTNNAEILRIGMKVNMMRNHQQLMMNQMQYQLQAQQSQQMMFMMMATNRQPYLYPRQRAPPPTYIPYVKPTQHTSNNSQPLSDHNARQVPAHEQSETRTTPETTRTQAAVQEPKTRDSTTSAIHEPNTVEPAMPAVQRAASHEATHAHVVPSLSPAAHPITASPAESPQLQTTERYTKQVLGTKSSRK